MLWCNRRWFLAGAVALTGCGFTPVYGPDAQSNLRGQVLVQAPTTREEFELVRALELRLGQPNKAQYVLDYTLTITEEAVVVSQNQVQARFNVVGVLAYVLKSNAGDPVANGTAKAFTSYSSTGSTVSTDQSQRDARDRLMVLLADQTLARLAADMAK